jgi:thiol-disulfide isomerase/thioredoxin
MKRHVIAVAALVAVVLGWAFMGRVHADNDTSGLQGKAAPDFSLKTIDGKDVKLSDMKGSVVVLDFWATWCPPCRASLPHLNKVSQDKALADKGLKVYSINCKEKPDTAKDFLTKNNYSFNVALDSDGKTEESYAVTGIPTTVVVGKDGTVQHVVIGYGGEETAKEIDDAVAAALAK